MTQQAEEQAVALPQGARWWAVLTLLFIIAFAIRFAYLARMGFNSFGAYDDGVHYAAAANLIAGNLPYKDFLFLHPPGIVLLGSPFAALGHLIGDPLAFNLFRISFQLVGAASVVLVAIVLRRFGWASAITGGVLLALSFPAVYGTRSALLEPVGELGILLALAAIGRGADLHRPRLFLLAGVAAGVACDMKVWYIAPALALLLFAPGWAARWRFATGMLIAMAVVYLPFFLQAPTKMFNMLVIDQLGRPRLDSLTMGVRARSILGVGTSPGDSIAAHIPAKPVVVALVVVTVFLVLLLLVERRAWILLAVLAANLGIVLLSPSYFQHYAILTATPLALVGGAAVGVFPTQLADRSKRRRALAAAFATVGILGALVVNWRHDFPKDRKGEQLSASMALAIQQVDGCVKSDDPTVLVLANVVTRNLARGCEVRPDLSGMSYDWAKRVVDGEPVSRGDNPVFQREALRYLSDSDASIRLRSGTFDYTPEVREVLERGGLLFEDNGRKLYATAK